MKILVRNLQGLVAALLLASGAPNASRAAAVEAVDANGATIRIAHPARRIVSLAPHITEILFAAGAGAQIVGAVDYSDYPPPATGIPRVGRYDNFDLERILALKPDLVVAWRSGNSGRQVAQLESLGLRVYRSEPRQLEDIARDIERLGALAGSDEQGRAAAEKFREHYKRLIRTYSQRPRLRVFYQIWDSPLMTVSDAHLISRVIHDCGGRNVFGPLPMLTPVIDVEALIGADPEVILAGGMGKNSSAWLEAWKRYPALHAARKNNLFFIPPDLLQRNGPRILEGAERVCRALEQARGR